MQNVSWDAIIVNYNGSVFLDPCLRALTRMPSAPERIIVVDNASTDDSITELAGWPQADTIRLHENLGYAGGANAGAASSDASILVFMNPDVELDPQFGQQLVSIFKDTPDLGAAGAKLRYPDSDLIQHAGGHVHWPVLTTSHVGEMQPDDGSYDQPSNADYLTGAALAVRREAFEREGGFDTAFFPAYWEDVDLCYRLRAGGWTVRYQPELTGVHHEGSGQQRGDDYFHAWTMNRLRFASRHLGAEQWWREFVPAEVERLRGEISAIDGENWLIRSGAASIEQIARAGTSSTFSAEPVSSPQPLKDVITTIRDLHHYADPSPGPIRPSDGIGTRLKRFLSRFSGRLYAEDLYWQQRQFNDAVVRAFEAQDRLNREHVAQILFSMLLIARSTNHNRAPGTVPTSPPGSLDILPSDNTE
jgi:O-antigen biosynthesis protein